MMPANISKLLGVLSVQVKRHAAYASMVPLAATISLAALQNGYETEALSPAAPANANAVTERKAMERVASLFKDNRNDIYTAKTAEPEAPPMRVSVPLQNFRGATAGMFDASPVKRFVANGNWVAHPELLVFEDDDDALMEEQPSPFIQSGNVVSLALYRNRLS